MKKNGIKIKIVGVLSLVILLILGQLMYSHTSSLRSFLFGYTHSIKPTPHMASVNKWRFIPPQKNPANTPGATFSLDFAKEYINSNPFYGGVTITGKHPTIEEIYFASDKDVAPIAEGHDPGLPPDAPVLVAIVKGPFLLSMIGSPDNGKPPVANEVIQVYDAHTGFLRMWGHWK